MENKSFKYALIYELLGMMAITIARNLGGSIPYVLLIVTWLAWDVSGAHFNAAITVGNLIFDKDKISENSKSCILTILFQAIGAVIGVFISYIGSAKWYPTADTHAFNPSPPVYCPAYRVDRISGCNVQGISFHVFFLEFIASTLFVCIWLVIRYSEIKSKWSSYIKPILVMMAYQGAGSITSSTSGGPINPTLALEVWIWSASYYTDIDPKSSQTDYEIGHYGRYVWVYLSAPLVASILGAFLAKQHI
jgi:glycerol uptake facilitator-like aquaporin